MNEKEPRNRIIFDMLSKRRATTSSLAREHGISRQRVSQIFLREKARLENGDLSAFLDAGSSRALEEAFSSCNMMRLRQEIAEDPAWEERLRKVPGCGKPRLARIKEALIEAGIIAACRSSGR